jgi:hypothetical protein
MIVTFLKWALSKFETHPSATAEHWPFPPQEEAPKAKPAVKKATTRKPAVKKPAVKKAK